MCGGTPRGYEIPSISRVNDNRKQRSVEKRKKTIFWSRIICNPTEKCGKFWEVGFIQDIYAVCENEHYNNVLCLESIGDLFSSFQYYHQNMVLVRACVWHSAHRHERPKFAVAFEGCQGCYATLTGQQPSSLNIQAILYKIEIRVMLLPMYRYFGMAIMAGRARLIG